MKLGVSFIAQVLFVCMFCAYPATGQANDAVGEKQPQQIREGVYIWSKSDPGNLTDGEKVKVHHQAEVMLLDKIRNGLLGRDLKVNFIESERDLGADPNRYVLEVTLERVSLGFRGPFGRISKVKVSYILKNREQKAIFTRSREELSHSKWQNCVIKISDEIADETAAAINNKTPPTNISDKAEAPKDGSSSASVEERLQELDSLKSKGLITEEEYKAKRKDILREL